MISPVFVDRLCRVAVLDVSPQVCEAFLRIVSIVNRSDWDGRLDGLRQLDHAQWQAVATLARRHGLSGLAARNLEWAAKEGNFEIPIAAELESYRKRALVQNLMRKAEARRISLALDAAGIRFMVLKGVILTEEILGDLSLRNFGDCDLLVAEEHLQRSFEILRVLGYALEAFDAHLAERLGVSTNPEEAYRVFQAMEHDSIALRHPSGSLVDLHWRLTYGFLGRQDWKTIWENCRPPENRSGLAGLRASPELMVAFLAYHYHHHSFTELKPLIDFYQCAITLRERIDPARLEKVAKALGLGAILEMTVAICNEFFIPRPELEKMVGHVPLRARLIRRTLSVEHLLDPQAQADSRILLRKIALSGGLRPAAMKLRRVLVPAPRELEFYFEQPFRAGMYPRYYLRQLSRVIAASGRQRPVGFTR